MCGIQDLSPILPDPLVQEANQLALRKVILQCVSDLARRVGDSLHLLEALGGIVGKLLGPSPLTTAVLECVAAAALAVNFFPAKVRLFLTNKMCSASSCLVCLTAAARAMTHDQRSGASHICLVTFHFWDCIRQCDLRCASRANFCCILSLPPLLPQPQAVLFSKASRMRHCS